MRDSFCRIKSWNNFLEKVKKTSHEKCKEGNVLCQKVFRRSRSDVIMEGLRDKATNAVAK